MYERGNECDERVMARREARTILVMEKTTSRTS